MVRMAYMSAREQAIYQTKSTGVLPAMKLKQNEDVLPWVQAMYDGGARVVEITMTSPGVLEHFEAIRTRVLRQYVPHFLKTDRLDALAIDVAIPGHEDRQQIQLAGQR